VINVTIAICEEELIAHGPAERHECTGLIIGDYLRCLLVAFDGMRRFTMLFLRRVVLDHDTHLRKD
jgi:hypothetical protein